MTRNPDTTPAGEAFRRYREIVPDWRGFLASLTAPLPTTVWANPRRIGRDALRRLLESEGFDCQPLDWHPHALRLPADFSPGRHWGRLAGLFQTQEEVAMLPAMLLDPRPGERVLDLCAAPGNKTAQLAVAMHGRGTVLANDVQPHRLKALRQSVNRLGLTNVSVTAHPGQDYPLRAGAFDRVLVDAPCSGEGTWRKSGGRADGGAGRSGFHTRLVRRQRDLLRRAVRLCRPGGRVVYATCTFAPEENEAVVDAILREHGDLLRVRPVTVAAFDVDPGLTRWQGTTFSGELAATARIWPHRNDSGGFYVAVLDKTDGERIQAPTRPPERADAGPLAALLERLDVPESALDGLVPGPAGSKYLYLSADDHRLPARMPISLTGLPSIGIAVRPPKPTTAAAMAFGPQARRNRIELDAGEARTYLRREPLRLTAGRLDDVSGPGYVLARYRGHVLGVAHAGAPASDGSVALASLFPKSWAGQAAPDPLP